MRTEGVGGRRERRFRRAWGATYTAWVAVIAVSRGRIGALWALVPITVAMLVVTVWAGRIPGEVWATPCAGSTLVQLNGVSPAFVERLRSRTSS